MVLEARCPAWSRGALTTALVTARHSRRSRLEEWIKSRAPRTRCPDHHPRRRRIGMPRTSRRQRQNTRRAKPPKGRVPQLEQMHFHAAGIDVGATEHWVAVPADRDAQPVRRFGTFTADLYALAEWLRQCQIDTVVMESTGVYGSALCEVLEERGCDVKLVAAHQARQVPGRKTDVKD